MFTIDKDRTIELKMIDWATWIDIVKIDLPNTPEYYNNPQLWDPKTEKVIIKNDEQRYKNEFY